MNIFLQFTCRKMSVVLCFSLMLFSVTTQADTVLTESLLDRWLTTSEAFNKNSSIRGAFTDNAKFEQKYTSAEFKALDKAGQNKAIDSLLKEEGLYDTVYSIVNQYDWDSAGSYMRISERIGKGMAAHLQKMMAGNLPPEQAKMVIEAAGGSMMLDARPEDTAFVGKHWVKISSFMQKNFNMQ